MNLQPFLAARCIVGDGCQDTSAKLYEAIVRWTLEKGEPKPSKVAFGKALRKIGFIPRERGKKNIRTWWGLQLSFASQVKLLAPPIIRSPPLAPPSPEWTLHLGKAAWRARKLATGEFGLEYRPPDRVNRSYDLLPDRSADALELLDRLRETLKTPILPPL